MIGCVLRAAGSSYDEQLDHLDPRRSDSVRNHGAVETEPLTRRLSQLLQLRRFSEAVADCDAVLELIPTNARALSLRGMARRRQRDYPGALADYTAAIRQTPDTPAIYNLRAAVYYQQAEYAHAVQDQAGAHRGVQRAHPVHDAVRAPQLLRDGRVDGGEHLVHAVAVLANVVGRIDRIEHEERVTAELREPRVVAV